MNSQIPYEKWQPLSVANVVTLLDNAPFQWCLAGGYAIELFIGESIREHGDIDIIVFRDEQLVAQSWLKDWRLYAADPPGSLRFWQYGEFLPIGIHDIWGHRVGASVWELQIMIMEVDGNEWFNRRNPAIRGARHKLITTYQNVPCIRAEIQLMYKSLHQRPKDVKDFRACLPLLDIEAKTWLKKSLFQLYPDGHEWLQFLV